LVESVERFEESGLAGGGGFAVGELFFYVVGLGECGGDFAKAGGELRGECELFVEGIGRGVDAGIHFDCQGLLGRNAVGGEFDGVSAGRNEWAVVDEVGFVDGWWKSEAQVPDEAVRAGFGGERLRGFDPVWSEFDGGGIGLVEFFVAGEGTNQIILRIENFELHACGGFFVEIVIENGAVGRIFELRFVGWNGSAFIPAGTNTIGGGGWEKARVGDGVGRSGCGRCCVGLQIAEWRHVVENPERAAEGGDDQIVFVNDEIADGSVG